jgi:hypothetical protein
LDQSFPRDALQELLLFLLSQALELVPQQLQLQRR